MLKNINGGLCIENNIAVVCNTKTNEISIVPLLVYANDKIDCVLQNIDNKQFLLKVFKETELVQAKNYISSLCKRKFFYTENN